MIGKIREGLRKTREALSERVSSLFSKPEEVSETDTIEGLEEALLTADVGLSTIGSLLERLPKEARANGASLKQALRGRMLALWPPAPGPEGPPPKPWVNVMVGVNGVGKTTTLGKLAAQRVAAGQNGVLAAADTFRAAAAEPNSSRSGRRGPGPSSCASRRGPTPPPWLSTPSRPRSRGTWTSSSSTRPGGST
jgi:fused signal recognition particle receptor